MTTMESSQNSIELFEQLKQHFDCVHKQINYQNVYIRSTVRLMKCFRKMNGDFESQFEELNLAYDQMDRSYRYWRKRTKKLKKTNYNPFDALQELFGIVHPLNENVDHQQQQFVSTNNNNNNNSNNNENNHIIIINPFESNFALNDSSTTSSSSNMESKQSFIDHLNSHFTEENNSSTKKPDKIVLLTTSSNTSSSTTTTTGVPLMEKVNSCDDRIKVVRSGYLPEQLLQQTLNESSRTDNSFELIPAYSWTNSIQLHDYCNNGSGGGDINGGSNNLTVIHPLNNIKQTLTNLVVEDHSGQPDPSQILKLDDSPVVNQILSTTTGTKRPKSRYKKFECGIDGCLYRSSRQDFLQTHIKVIHYNNYKNPSYIQNTLLGRKEYCPNSISALTTDTPLKKALEFVSKKSLLLNSNLDNQKEYKEKYHCSIDGCSNQYITYGGLDTHIKLIHRPKIQLKL